MVIFQITFVNTRLSVINSYYNLIVASTGLVTVIITSLLLG